MFDKTKKNMKTKIRITNILTGDSIFGVTNIFDSQM